MTANEFDGSGLARIGNLVAELPNLTTFAFENDLLSEAEFPSITRMLLLHDIRPRMFTFCLGSHRRLGRDSPIQLLNQDVLMIIRRKMFEVAWEDAHS
jgi:hypothetical protein